MRNSYSKTTHENAQAPEMHLLNSYITTCIYIAKLVKEYAFTISVPLWCNTRIYMNYTFIKSVHIYSTIFFFYMQYIFENLAHFCNKSVIKG